MAGAASPDMAKFFMEEENPESNAEKPRYLLPYGCKDLIDAIRPQERQRQSRQKGPNQAVPVFATSPVSTSFEPSKFPQFVSLPDSVTVRELAAALGLKTFVLIKKLMGMDIFLNPHSQLGFVTASKVCSHYGVRTVRAS